MFLRVCAFKKHRVKSLTTTPIINASIEAGLCFGELYSVIDPLTRLVRFLDNPSSLKFMSSMIMKELVKSFGMSESAIAKES